MNWLRKIGNWLWLNKERMVLAVMVAILVFRVYQVLNPEAETDVRMPRPPGPVDEGVGPGPPPPPPPPDLTDDWSRLWRRNPIRWEVPQAGSGQDTSGTSTAEPLDIQLVQLREVGSGDWRARIRTQGRTAWYSAGEQFEQYTLMEIDSAGGCVTIFSDRTQRNERVCMPEAQQ